MKKYIYTAITVLLLASCGSKQAEITSMQGEYIPVMETKKPNSELTEFINSYKVELDKEMTKVIAHSSQYMITDRPEGLLTNLTSDFMLALHKSHTGNQHVDIACMNVRGIRAPIARGEITLGDMYDAFPFDNALVLVKIRGKYLTEIFESYAAMGGAGLSKNVRLLIKDSKLVSATIDGKPVDDDKIYTMVTLDYLADGNDGMEALKKAESVVQTGVKLRDFMIDNVTKLEKQNKPVTAKLDGRITIIND